MLLWHEGYNCKYELPQHCITPHKTASELFRQTKAIDGAKAGAEAFLGDLCVCCSLPRYPQALQEAGGVEGREALPRAEHHS